MKSVAIIVGHQVNGPDKGAVAYNGIAEATYNHKVALLLKEKLVRSGIPATVYLRDNGGFKAITKDMAIKKPDLSIELHFNSFSLKSTGCECLALKGDLNSIRFADFVTDIVSSEYSSKQRDGDGVVEISRGGRGYLNLKLVRDTLPKDSEVVLVEPFFANFKTSESEKFINDPVRYAELLNFAIWHWLTTDEKKFKKVPDQASLSKSPANIKEFVTGLLKKGYGN
jgi:N-acetylmuramoyl-L-alanine amidase